MPSSKKDSTSAQKGTARKQRPSFNLRGADDLRTAATEIAALTGDENPPEVQRFGQELYAAIIKQAGFDVRQHDGRDHAEVVYDAINFEPREYIGLIVRAARFVLTEEAPRTAKRSHK